MRAVVLGHQREVRLYDASLWIDDGGHAVDPPGGERT